MEPLAPAYLTSTVLTYDVLAIFIGTWVFGESVIITAFSLVHQNLMDFLPVFVTGVLATFLADIFWYVIGHTTHNHIRHYEKLSIKVDLINRFINKSIGGNIFLAIVLTKYFIGFRIVMATYCGLQSMPFRKFIFYDLVAVFIYISILFPVGVGLAIGVSFLDLESVLANVLLVIGLVVTLALGVRFAVRRHFDSLKNK